MIYGTWTDSLDFHSQTAAADTRYLGIVSARTTMFGVKSERVIKEWLKAIVLLVVFGEGVCWIVLVNFINPTSWLREFGILLSFF